MSTGHERSQSDKNTTIPLVRWIWRSYFRTSLMPLLLVEVALITIYFASNAISTKENIKTIRQLAEHELSQLATREASSIDQQLKGITQATEFLRRETERVMVKERTATLDDPTRFTYSKDGAYYTTRDTGGSAVFFSGYQPVGNAGRAKALRSAGLDPAFKGIQQAFPLIVQVYYNTHDSLNRIYPYFDVISQYATRMNIPSFNFYYEADAAHNPSRGVVWTDVYVDPAGQGWMTSCIAPVYRGAFLEGVVGSDVTVGTVISDVLNLSIPWDGYALLVSREGTIIALPPAGESDWHLREYSSHSYNEAIKQDTFKPDEFNLLKRTTNIGLSQQISQNPLGIEHISLSGDRLVAWATIPETGWKLLVVAPEKNIYQPAQTLSDKLNKVALLMVVGMVLFYVVFFIVLYRRARAMSLFLSAPLSRIDGMISNIAAGQYKPVPLNLQVSELDHTARGIILMANQLDTAWTRQTQAETELLHQKQHLQSVFDLSPDAFIATDENSRIVLVNPAFLNWTGSRAEQWLGMHLSKFWKRLLSDCRTQPPPPQDNDLLRIELLLPEARTLLCAARETYVAASEEKGITYAGSVIYLRDITGEEELVRMKSEFLSLAAHELRTPLTSILGYSELLLNDRIEGEMRTESLHVIHTQSKWLVNIINDLVDLSRIDANGSKNLELMAVDCAELAQATLDILPPVIGRDAVECSLLPGFTVSADPAKFQQALLNVLENAYQYSSQGPVKLGMTFDHDQRRIGIRVSDQGIGMSASQISHVFDRFWRGDNSGSTPGTGLGMSLSKEIIHLLNGTIEISSKQGTGTQVTIWLPIITKHKDHAA
jgi:signal transduction histidine kinase